jgi:hypothetical protein
MPQVTVPCKRLPKVSLTEECVSEADAEKTVSATGKIIAPIINVVIDRKFINSFKKTSFFVSWADLPESPGWYYVDRENICLKPIDEAASHSFERDEKLHILASAIRASKTKRLLILELDQDLTLRKGRMRIKGCGPIFLAPVAQCKAEHANTRQNIANVLRS